MSKMNSSSANAPAVHSQRLHFVTLSSLMGSRSLSGLPTRQLKVLLEAGGGVAQIDSLSTALLPKALQALEGHKNPLEWLKKMVEHSDLLRRRGLDYLVVDTLQYTPKPELNEVTPLLQTLSQQGVQIVVVDQDRTPIFFTSMREVIRTDDFMKIYVKSLWSQSRALGRKRLTRAEPAARTPEAVKPMAAKAAQPARGFRFMERIFVA
jgi:hypothetical protein